MPVVKPYPLPSDAQTRPMPINLGGANGSAASFGPSQMPQVQQQWGEARDLQVAGGQLERASNNLGEVALGIAKDVNESRVQELNNQFIAAQQDLLYNGDSAFYRQQGKNAIDAAPVATQRILELKKGILDQTSNQYQKDRLTRILDGHVNEVTGGMSRFVAAQSVEWQKNVDSAGIKLRIDEVGNSWNDPAKVDILAEEAAKGAAKMAMRTDSDPNSPTVLFAAKQARSAAYARAIISALNAGDTAYAVTLYDRVKPGLDTATDERLDNAIKTGRTRDSAQTEAARLMDPTYDGRTRVYESGKMEYNRLGSGAFGPFQFMPGTWADVRAKHPELNLPEDMTKATEEQHIAAHKAFKTDNASEIQKAGFPVTAANLYLAQRFGAAGATTVLRANPNTPLTNLLPANWFDKNPDLKGQTAGSFRSLAEARYAGVTDLGIDTGSKPPVVTVSGDPLRAEVDAANGVAPKNGPDYKDTNQMLLDLDATYNNATKENDTRNAGNIEKRDAVQAELNRAYTLKKREIEEAKLQVNKALDDIMTSQPITDRKQIPINLWNQLSYEKQRSVDATIAHNLKGQEPTTDWNLYYQIQRGLTSADPIERKKWADASLWEARPRLANEQFTKLADMQGSVRKGDPNQELLHVRNINQMVDDTLASKPLSIDPTPKPGSEDATKANKFRRAVQEQLTALETQLGRKSTPDEQRKIIDAMVIEVVTKPGRFWDDTKRRYEMTIKDVPEDEKGKITDALKRAGIPVTDQTIIDLFARKNAKAPK